MFDIGEEVIYMKIGTHAQEPLGDIIARKMREIDEAGFALWGYGGNTCHPTTMIQPFALRHATTSSGPLILAMQPIVSNHNAEPIRASQYSKNGTDWETIPSSVNVLGSRYALWLSNLRQVDENLHLSSTRVALGNSQGKVGSKYVQGHVDKACLEIVAPGLDEEDRVPIRLVADLASPYAVFVRN